MEVMISEIRSGDAILWKGGGPVDLSFSFLVGLFFPDLAQAEVEALARGVCGEGSRGR